MILLPYQIDWIADSLKPNVKVQRICEKSRRIGLTFAEAAWSVRRRLVLKENHWFSSADERTSKEFIQYCIQWAKIFNLTLPSHERVDVEKATTETVIFPNGSKICAVSSSPRALRGKGGSVTLDEFAFHEDQAELYKAAQAVSMWGGHIRIISTHNGPATHFAHMVEKARNNELNFKLTTITLEDAVSQGLSEKIPGDHLKLLPDKKACADSFLQGIKDTCLSEEQYKQEYCCKPISLRSLITEEEYTKLIIDKEIPCSLDARTVYNPLYVGIDIGRTNDLTVVWVLEKGFDPTATIEQLKNVYRTVCILDMKNTEFPIQFQRIKQIISHPQIERVLVDMGAVGRQLSDDLQAEFGDIVQPIGINATNKALLCEGLKKAVQYELISVPEDHNVKKDFLSMARKASLKGNLVYEGQTSFSHCDYFMAASLAYMATTNAASLSLATV